MAAQFRFTFPKSLGGKPVVCREIPVGEQMNVADAMSGAKLMHELGARMVTEYDGVAVTADNRDEVWSRFNAKQRDLLFKAYRRLHVVDEEEAAAFFASESVVVSEG